MTERTRKHWSRWLELIADNAAAVMLYLFTTIFLAGAVAIEFTMTADPFSVGVPAALLSLAMLLTDPPKNAPWLRRIHLPLGYGVTLLLLVGGIAITVQAGFWWMLVVPVLGTVVIVARVLRAISKRGATNA